MSERSERIAVAAGRRAAEVATAARLVLERDGADGLTMRAVADELGIRAPSLYKHVAGKPAIEVALVAAALTEIGEAMRAALARPGRPSPVHALLVAYRRWPEVRDLERPDLWVRRTCANLAVSQFRRRLVELRAVARLSGRRAAPLELSDGGEEFWAAVRAYTKPGAPTRAAAAAPAALPVSKPRTWYRSPVIPWAMAASARGLMARCTATFTNAGLPEAKARSRAGPRSSGRSTYSPYPPNACATISYRLCSKSVATGRP